MEVRDGLHQHEKEEYGFTGTQSDDLLTDELRYNRLTHTYTYTLRDASLGGILCLVEGSAAPGGDRGRGSMVADDVHFRIHKSIRFVSSTYKFRSIDNQISFYICAGKFLFIIY